MTSNGKRAMSINNASIEVIVDLLAKKAKNSVALEIGLNTLSESNPNKSDLFGDNASLSEFNSVHAIQGRLDNATDALSSELQKHLPEGKTISDEQAIILLRFLYETSSSKDHVEAIRFDQGERTVGDIIEDYAQPDMHWAKRALKRPLSQEQSVSK